MIKVSVTSDVSGLVTLRGSALRKAQRIAMNKSAVPVKSAAVSNTENLGGSGRLAKSMRIKVKILGNGRAWAVVGPSTKFTRSGGKYKRGPKRGSPKPKIRPSKYAPLVESGGPHNQARHPMANAAQSTASQFVDTYNAEVNRAVKECEK